MNKKNIYSISNLEFTYSQNKLRRLNPIVTHQVLYSINVNIDFGEIVCISGPSGSGKSTLLNILGFIEVIQSGHMAYDGREVRGLSPLEINRIRLFEVGFVFQDFQLLDVLTVEENVEYFVARQGHSKAKRQMIVDQSLDAVGVRDCAKQYPRELSGGQKQRVAFARAIAKNPKVIIADEPTANLDSANTVRILDLVKNLNNSSGLTVIMASHDPLVVENCQRVIEMRDGLVARERPGDIKHAG